MNVPFLLSEQQKMVEWLTFLTAVNRNENHLAAEKFCETEQVILNILKVF